MLRRGILSPIAVLALLVFGVAMAATRPGFKNGELSIGTKADSVYTMPTVEGDSGYYPVSNGDGTMGWAQSSASGDTIIAGTDTVFINVLIDSLRYYDTSIADSTVDLKEGFSPSAWTKAGEALSFGEVVYFATDSTWKLADADTLSGAGSFYSRRGMGFVTADISNGSTGTIMTRGVATAVGWSWTKIGAYLYVSTTAGGLTEAPADTTAGKAVQIVGWVLNPKMIIFDANFPYSSK